MGVILYLIGLASLAGGGLAFLSAKSVIHEIFGGIGLLVWVTAWGFAAVIGRLGAIQKTLAAATAATAATAPEAIQPPAQT